MSRDHYSTLLYSFPTLLTATRHFQPSKPARKSEVAEVQNLDSSVTWEHSFFTTTDQNLVLFKRTR
jgi:hypothetical protein